jgi:hypothetical protein
VRFWAPLLAVLLLVPMIVSQANQTADATWLRGILTSPEQGGLPADSVVVSWWSVSTTLWYGQKVEGLRRDVIRMYLGRRPVLVDRLGGGIDGMQALSEMFEMMDFGLPDGSAIEQVTNTKGTQ